MPAMPLWPPPMKTFKMKEDIFQLGIKALITDDVGKLLLLKVNTDKLSGYQGEAYWDIPGGRIERGATVEETLFREVEEETGIKDLGSVKTFIMVLSNIRIPFQDTDTGLILCVKECKATTPVNVVLSDEHIDYGWFSPKEASLLLAYKYPPEFTDKIASL